MRKTWRALRKPRTAVPLILVYGNIVFVLTMFTLGRLLSYGEEDVASFYAFITDETVAVALSLLFALAMTGPLAEFPLAFNSAEIQLLYPSPISRTSLTLYKLESYIPALALVGLIGATLVEGGTRQWFLAVPGVLVYVTFVLLSMVALGMLARLPRIKFVVLGAMAVATIAAVAELLPLVRAGVSVTDFKGTIETLRATYTARLLVAAGLPFGRVIVNGFDTQWLVNFGFIVALTVAMFAAVLRLDVNFYETSLRATARREERLERMRRGRVSGGAWSGARRLRMPMLPRLGGAGPTFRRHALSALRDRSMLWLVVVIVAAPLAVGIYFRITGSEGVIELRRMAVWLTIYMAFFVTSIVRFDFRADYTMLDYLKVLPVNPFALAAGTIAIPSLFALSIQILPPVVFALASGVWLISLTWLVFLVPCNVMWFALDNAFYLRAPTPMQRGLQSNPNAMGQQLFASLGVAVTLALVGGCAAGIYYLARMMSGSMIIAQLAASGFLWPCAAGAIFLTGRAFRDLDLGRDRL